MEELEKEGIFEQLGISPEDLRSQQMKEIENQLALGPSSSHWNRNCWNRGIL